MHFALRLVLCVSASLRLAELLLIKFASDLRHICVRNKILGGPAKDYKTHLGCIYQKLGEKEEAKQHFEECLEIIPDHKKAREYLFTLKQ
ncbi:tetratricopeptide repeat protein [bacterium]|nr:tetratricopeptide repeat protein [bacterium]